MFINVVQFSISMGKPALETVPWQYNKPIHTIHLNSIQQRNSIIVNAFLLKK